MKFQTIKPSQLISEYVHSIAVFESFGITDVISFPLFANGFPGIAFQTGDSEVYSCKNEKIDKLFIYGQTVSPIELRTTGKYKFISFFLHPHVVYTLFGIKAKELTDCRIDLHQTKLAKELNLKEQLCNSDNSITCINILNKYVLELIKVNNFPIMKTIQFAASKLLNSNETILLKNIYNELGTTERSLQRLFEMHVGIPPMQFNKICRFQRAFQSLNQKKIFKLSELVYKNGYSDQSHFNRVFKEFTNLTPTKYLETIANLEIEIINL